jgi:hypothetical protein
MRSPVVACYAVGSGAVEMSTSVADLEALLAEDPTFEGDDEWAQGAPPTQQVGPARRSRKR